MHDVYNICMCVFSISIFCQIIIGFGKHPDHWLLRSSFGNGFADGGYFRIARGKNLLLDIIAYQQHPPTPPPSNDENIAFSEPFEIHQPNNRTLYCDGIQNQDKTFFVPPIPCLWWYSLWHDTWFAVCAIMICVILYIFCHDSSDTVSFKFFYDGVY